ncbi:MAG: hypothetical protein RLZZ353_1411 [Actinomycetota bacterium]
MRRAGGRVAVAVLLGAVATAVVRRSLLVVRGPSMRPTLEAGDVVVTLPLPPSPPLPARWRERLLTPGRIVVLADPARPEHRIVKRVAAVHADGVEVRGDDPGWSIDSRVFGRVPPAQVRRLVLGRWPARGPVRRPDPRPSRRQPSDASDASEGPDAADASDA